MKYPHLSLSKDAEWNFADALVGAQGPLLNAVRDYAGRDADECVSRIWEKAWEQRRRFDPSVMNFDVWLWNIAQSVFGSMERERSERDKEINIADLEHFQKYDFSGQRWLSSRTRLYLQKCSTDNDRAAMFIDTDGVYEKVTTLMDQVLCPTARLALEYRSEGHSRRDIAEMLGITMGSLRGHLQRARADLRALLVEENNGSNGDGHHRDTVAA